MPWVSDLEAGEVGVSQVPDVALRRGKILVAEGRWDEAATLLLTTIEAAEAEPPGSLAETWSLRFELARLTARRGELAAALPRLESARARAVTLWGDAAWEVIRTHAALAELCSALGQLDDVARWSALLPGDGPQPQGFLDH
ncbi:MAG: hypothetical protein ACI9EF_001710 [Pseudohongiellaceae bacterium]|jgi:hypothetical protein